MKNSKTRTTRHPSTGRRPQRRTELFLLVADSDDTPVFTRVTDDLGRAPIEIFERQRTQRQAEGLPIGPLPRPAAVCSMRVSPEVVAFRFSGLTKKRVPEFLRIPLEVPVGALARLERNLPEVPPGPGEIVLEVTVADDSTPAPVADGPQGPAPAGVDVLGALFADENGPTRRPRRAERTERWQLSLTRDDAGVVSFDEDGEAVTSPGGPWKVSVYLASPMVGRTLAVSYMGMFAGRPGQGETKARVAAQVLHLAAQLGEFRALSGINDVLVPARPAASAASAYQPGAKVSAEMAVALYHNSDDIVPFAQGKVEVEMDLVASSDRILFHLRPEANLVESFEPFRPVAAQCVTQQVEAALTPEEAARAQTEIVLGEITEETVVVLRRALAAIEGGAHLTVTRWVPMHR
jgi:hypothetical protein